ncbi:MAG TPA: RidA family protein, partial [Chloroflexota bacterium]
MADRPHLAEIFAAGDAIPAGVRIDDLVYLARVDGREPGTGALPDGVEDQLARAFQNAGALLEQAGATLDNVAHVTIFLRDLGDRGAINPPWLKTFPDASDRPTYKFMAAALPSGVHAQLQVLAVAGARR